MIGHLELATGILTSHASWVWFRKICPRSRIFLRRVSADLELIVNEFKQIGFTELIRLLIMNAATGDSLGNSDHIRWQLLHR